MEAGKKAIYSSLRWRSRGEKSFQNGITTQILEGWVEFGQKDFSQGNNWTGYVLNLQDLVTN